MISRRAVLRQLIMAGGYCLLPLGSRGWALAAPQNANNGHVIVVLMRGAVDGLSIVTPYREENYYAARPTIAIAPPGQSDGLLDLDGYFWPASVIGQRYAAVAKPHAGFRTSQRFTVRNAVAFRGAGYHGNGDAEFGAGFAGMDEWIGANPARHAFVHPRFEF